MKYRQAARLPRQVSVQVAPGKVSPPGHLPSSWVDAIRLAHSGISDPGQVGERDLWIWEPFVSPLNCLSWVVFPSSLVTEGGRQMDSMGFHVMEVGGPQNSQGAPSKCSVVRARETIWQSGPFVQKSGLCLPLHGDTPAE